tara:strand:+ start:257 stop:715 length:459 start_codon:yes stop_codon:yes gene_type:complete
MNVVATTIKGIIEAQGLTYLRAANPNDLNELVHSYDLSNGVGVYANLPTVSNMTYSQNGNVLMEYGIEIYYLKLSTGTDDTATQIDVILDALKPKADGMIDKLNASNIIALSDFIDGYELEAIESINITSEVLSGWKLSFVLPIFRDTFECS